MSVLRRVIGLLLLIFWTILMLAVFFLSKLLPNYDSQRLPRFYHAGVCRIIGLSIEFKGELSEHVPTIFVSNHISYLDIFALGQKIQASFVAKSDIASWPVMGKLASFQNTLFIERSANRAKQQLQQFQSHLESQRNLILFPEGTSTNGAEVKTFKSSLFAAAENPDVQLQPVTIVYTQYEGKGMTQSRRDDFAWYADMPFGSHFMKMLSLGKYEAVIEFHEPMRLADFENRKQCSNYAESVVRKSLKRELIDSGSSFENNPEST